jgi:hypothetical protein
MLRSPLSKAGPKVSVHRARKATVRRANLVLRVTVLKTAATVDPVPAADLPIVKIAVLAPVTVARVRAAIVPRVIVVTVVRALVATVLVETAAAMTVPVSMPPKSSSKS